MEALRDQYLVMISTPIYAIIILLEIFLTNARHLRGYTWRDTLQNLYLTILNMSCDVGFRFIYVAILDWFFRFKLGIWSEPLGIAYWVALVIAEDFMFYWLHRIDHSSRFFWAVHVTHHSSEQFNFSVGFRSSVFQPLYRFIYFIPLALLGFKPLDIVFIYSATQIWGILVHTELIDKMGFLEYFLVTPSHHRVHHASNALYLDRNLGMFLIIWDKIFGTFQPELPAEQYQPIRYGLTKSIGNPNPIKLVFHEWYNIWRDNLRHLSWGNRLRYIFGPPGWSHDGSTLTSDQLREQEGLGKSR